MHINGVHDVIYKQSGFKVQCHMFLRDSSTGKYKNNPFCEFKKNPVANEESYQVYFDTYTKRHLSFETVHFDENGQIFNQQKTFLGPRQFYDLSLSLEITISWLKSKNYEYLFNKNGDGKVIGLGGEPPFIPTIYKPNNEYIKFYPAVIKTEDGIMNEGIGIVSNKGPLIRIIYKDYFVFASTLLQFIKNNYNNFLQLTNLAYTGAVMKKLSKS